MFVITYSAAFLSILLSVCVVAFLLLHRSTQLTRALTLYALTAVLWIGSNAAADVAYTVPFLILASGLAFIGGSLSILMFLVLVDLLIDERLPSRLRLLCYSVPTVGVSLLAFSKLAIVDTYFPIGYPAQIVPGPLYAVTLVIMVASLIYGIARLVVALKQEESEARRVQLSYVLLGLILMLLGGLTFDIVLPLIGELSLYSLGPIASLFFILGTGYAITTHNLIDIRTQIQRGVVYSFLLALIIAVYTGALFLVLLLFPIKSEVAIYLSAFATMIVGIIGAPIVDRHLRKLTDPIFFKATYDYADTLHSLSSILYLENDLTELISKSEHKLACTLRTDSLQIRYGAEVVDEVDHFAVATGHAVTVPITRENVYMGYIHAGPRNSGDEYTPRDRRLLETFAYQASIAFSRAELYAITLQYAQDLEQTVKRRTLEIRTMQENERQMLIELSHNLQTPLAVFQARLEQLKLSEFTNTDLQSMEQPIRHLSEFIYDLLALARLETETPNIYKDCNISELVADVIEELEVIAQNRRVHVESTLESALIISGDERRLREALLNVANNALTYMNDTGERLVSISLTRESHEIHLLVSDTGRGINASELPHVFERFYRGSRTKETTHGNGLGLSIAKRIIEQHNGSIAVESEEGCGTTVHIRIPHSH